MQGLVPSYTKLGMASLLPNKELSRVKDSDDILVDGQVSSSIKIENYYYNKQIQILLQLSMMIYTK